MHRNRAVAAQALASAPQITEAPSVPVVRESGVRCLRLRSPFEHKPHRSPAETAAAIARLRRITFIILGVGIALLFAELGIGCALIPRHCSPAILIASGAGCMAMLATALLAFRRPAERLPVSVLAAANLVGFACVLLLMDAMP